MKPRIDWLENPEIFSVAREEAHSDHSFYSSEEEWEQKKESFKQSLNGEWKFAWYPNPDAVLEALENWGKALMPHDTVQVPGHIELQGYGQIQYTNVAYPWDGDVFLRPPKIDWEHNSVGIYVKEFALEPGLKGNRVFVSFQGADKAIYVWLNGAFIGYSEDSCTPAEFDLTGHVKETGNRICVAVFRHCSASWIEDQDFFRFSGLFRDVFLYAKPDAHIDDVMVRATLDDGYRDGRLDIRLRVSGMPGDVAYELRDAENAVITHGRMEPDRGQIQAEIDVGEVKKWDVGAPYLYTVLLRVYDVNGKLCEVVPCSTGFRRFEIKENVMLLNGKRLLINGVNRHEWNPRTGRAVSAEDMKKDIEVMKRNNINAVRTCHYPNQSLWYQLCDEAGICVMDETNLESHGSWQLPTGVDSSWNVPGSYAEWMECCLDRAKSMYERDKNHPCILWWSCGNESFMGDVIAAMCRYFHEKDPGRLVHYEGVIYDRAYDACTDVESRMYASPDAVREYMEEDGKKPMLLCEYMHDMGNSMGGMEDYMKLRDEFPGFQGGFIWDYIDQALYYIDQNGNEVLGYGGDFGDRPTDYAFSGNGIVFADRTEKPAMQEVRYWYQSEEMRREWDERNQRRSEAFCETMKEAGKTGTGQKMEVVRSDCNIGVKGDGFHYIFSPQEGGPVSIRLDGEEYLYRAPHPAFWRASTENDKGNGFPTKSAVWLGAEMFTRARSCTVEDGVEEGTEWVKICYTYEVPVQPSAELSVTYTVKCGDMHVKVSFTGNEALPPLPLLGLRFVLPERFNEYTWTGLSGETYPDRYRGGEFGTHRDQVEVSDYLVPQECKNHMNTYQMQIGRLVFVKDDEPFQCSVLPYTAVELENAFHKEELPESKRTVVSILGFMRGVGGIDSWGSDVGEACRLPAGRTYEYSFTLTSTDSQIR